MCVSFVCLFVIRFRFSCIFWFCFCLYVVNFLWILFSEKKASKQWIQFRLMFFFWFNITVLIIGPKTVSAKTKILRKIASEHSDSLNGSKRADFSRRHVNHKWLLIGWLYSANCRIYSTYPRHAKNTDMSFSFSTSNLSALLCLFVSLSFVRVGISAEFHFLLSLPNHP